ncbi:MAG: hypothetical protein IPM91_21940 [Bacteroidetes bacterium]|nr:hypothetical protein [Bacteroidota bacterium]
MYSYGKADGVRHIPNVLKLHTEQITSAYPNPFTDNTTIFYMADQDAFVRVKLFNNLGGFMGQIFDDLVEKGLPTSSNWMEVKWHPEFISTQ